MLSRLINNQFDNVIKCSKLVDNIKTDCRFHNKLRVNKIPKGKNTYCGELCCGVTTFVLGNILKNKIPIRMFINENGFGKNKTDHVFLKTYDIIIDPTYKQFLNDDRNSSFSNYNNYLYNSLPPFFVGTEKDLIKTISFLKKLNKEEFTHNIISNNIMNNWICDQEITEKLDNFNNIYNKKKVIKIIKSNNLFIENIF